MTTSNLTAPRRGTLFIGLGGLGARLAEWARLLLQLWLSYSLLWRYLLKEELSNARVGPLSQEEEGRVVSWLKKMVFSRLRGRASFGIFGRKGCEPAQPPSLPVMFIDVSGSMLEDRERVVFISYRREDVGRERPFEPLLANREMTWESLFQKLYGRSLPRSTSESPDLWGMKLSRHLRAPSGRLPLLRDFDPPRLMEVLAEIPAWQDQRTPDIPWLETASWGCHDHWTKKDDERLFLDRHELVWRAGERWGFFLNRALSYPEPHRLRHGDGLTQLGGLTRALSLAWMLLYRGLVALPAGLKLALHGAREINLLALAEGIAKALSVEVRPNELDHMNAFLVRTKQRSVIYLRKDLDAERRAWGVCHELAHVVLHHTSNSSYGLDPRWLMPEEVLAFDRQEAAADALASLWLHLCSGLMDIGDGLGRTDPAKAFRSRPSSLLLPEPTGDPFPDPSPAAPPA